MKNIRTNLKTVTLKGFVLFTNTTNFTYTEEQANSVMNLIGQNIFDRKELLELKQYIAYA